MALTEKDLIIGLQSENENIAVRYFKNVYEKYFKLVCFCISNYVKNSLDVEELANDTFVSLYLNRNRLDMNKSLKYYIVVIAKNKALSFTTKNNKYVDEPLEMATDISYYYENESNDVIKKLETILNEEELFIVINHLIYGYTFAELANKMNYTLNVVAGKYKRALDKAAKEIKREDYE